jgi:Uma2 family endonuclease
MVDSSLIEKSLTVPTYPIWRLTVEQYHEMIDAGILTDDDPVELLEGWLVTKMTKKPQHSLATQLTSELLARIIPTGWFVNIQEPITTADSEPEPDIIIVRGNRRDYTERYPSPQDVALVVEVSDATLQRDRTLKLRLYANARVTTYWILNLQDRQLEVYTNPTRTDTEADYQQRVVYGEADNVPLVIDGKEIARLAVREFLA